MRIKLVFIFSVLWISQCIVLSRVFAEPSRISTDKPQNYITYPIVSIPLKKSMPLRYFTMDINSSRKSFAVARIESGAELKLSSYVISKNIFEAHQNFMKGSDNPSMEEIRHILDSSYTSRFLEVIKKLSEERRAAESVSERDIVRFLEDDGVSPKQFSKLTPLEKEFYRSDIHYAIGKAIEEVPGEAIQVYFGTGFFEVAPETFPGGDKDIRYFLPLTEVLNGNVKIDLQKMKAEVFRGLSVFLFRDLGERYFDIDDSLGALRNDLSILGKYIASDCAIASCEISQYGKIGKLSLQLMEIFNVEFSDFFNEPEEDNQLVARKQLCLLRLFFNACKNLEKLEIVDRILKQRRVICSRSGILQN